MDLQEIGCEGMNWIELARHSENFNILLVCTKRLAWLCDRGTYVTVIVFPECLHVVIIRTSLASYSKMSGEGNPLVRNLSRRFCCSMSPQALDKVVAVVTLVL
jgi:hypothetical protein